MATVGRGYGEHATPQELFYPPVNFTCYGPAHAWSGSRWVANITAITNHKTITVWLGQETEDGARLLVGTIPHERFTHNASAARHDDQAAAEAVHIAANTMRDIPNLRELLDAAEHTESWHHDSWTIDGVPQSARISSSGHIWIGIAELDTVHIGIVAAHIPSQIDLAALTDTTAYGPDLAKPISANAVGCTTRPRKH